MIEMNHITYRYPGQKQPVFSDFSLQLKSSCVYGLLGKNGTGKSTLLYLIAGMLRPQEGTVCRDGAVTAKRPVGLLSEVFLVPEEIELPAMSIDQYVAAISSFYPHFDHATLQHCLKVFELRDIANLQALSMGQKKKAYMSIALAAGTRLMLMDEPTNGLDIPSKSQFRKVVAEHMTDDRTLIISTHQVHDVEQLLDHVLFISDREMLMDASIADIAAQYAFEVRTPAQMDDSVVYAEPSLQGNLVMTRRQAGQAETVVNLELLFNAVTKGLVKYNDIKKGVAQ